MFLLIMSANNFLFILKRIGGEKNNLLRSSGVCGGARTPGGPGSWD